MKGERPANPEVDEPFGQVVSHALGTRVTSEKAPFRRTGPSSEDRQGFTYRPVALHPRYSLMWYDACSATASPSGSGLFYTRRTVYL